jgi:hypothetical protein
VRVAFEFNSGALDCTQSVIPVLDNGNMEM